MGHASVVPDWCKHLPPKAVVGWTLVTFVVSVPAAEVVATAPIPAPVPVEVVAGFHGTTLDTSDIGDRAARILSDPGVPQAGPIERTRRRFAGASLAWRVPDLRPDLNPAWPPVAAGARDSLDCEEAFRTLRRHVGPGSLSPPTP